MDYLAMLKRHGVTAIVGCLCLVVHAWKCQQNVEVGWISLFPFGILHQRQLYRILSHHFFHKDRDHLGNSLVLLALIGSELEREWGSFMYALVIMSGMIMSPLIYCGIALLQRLLPFGHGELLTIHAIGFSGIIYQLSVLRAFTAKPGAKILYFGLEIPARINVSVILVIDQVMGQNISFWGHVAGILAGFLLLPVVRKLSHGRRNISSANRSFKGRGHRLGNCRQSLCARGVERAHQDAPTQVLRERQASTLAAAPATSARRATAQMPPAAVPTLRATRAAGSLLRSFRTSFPRGSERDAANREDLRKKRLLRVDADASNKQAKKRKTEMSGEQCDTEIASKKRGRDESCGEDSSRPTKRKLHWKV